MRIDQDRARAQYQLWAASLTAREYLGVGRVDIFRAGWDAGRAYERERIAEVLEREATGHEPDYERFLRRLAAQIRKGEE